MTITYLPNEMLKKIAPERKLKRLVSGNLTLNRTILSMFDGIDFISKRDLGKVALKTVKEYKKRYDEGETKRSAVADKKLLVNRVQSAVVLQVSQEIREEYEGERYEWLPSDADEPDPEHQLKYGKIYRIGNGEQPGDRYGCKCGMRILVKEDQLSL